MTETQKLIQGKRIIQVQFPGTTHKDYSYFTDDVTIKDGDTCVVCVSGEYKCVKVVATKGLSRSALNAASKWIVQKVDIETHKAREFKMQLVQEVKNKLHERRREMDEIRIYTELASSDPAIMELLEELKEIAPEMVPSLPEQAGKDAAALGATPKAESTKDETLL